MQWDFAVCEGIRHQSGLPVRGTGSLSLQGWLVYSGTSDTGPSEIGTTSLYKRHLLRHHANTCVSVLFYLRDRDNISTRDKTIY